MMMTRILRRPARPAASWLVLVLVLVALALSAGVAQGRVVEKVAAVVGDSVILGSEVEEKAAPLLAEATQITDPGKRNA
ncbi:MAG TPA: hypothetical protein VNO55_30820, partial [Polyangia bacterium]|nr:hypothetical protein [Polyangia bacterium]